MVICGPAFRLVCDCIEFSSPGTSFGVRCGLPVHHNRCTASPRQQIHEYAASVDSEYIMNNWIARIFAYVNGMHLWLGCDSPWWIINCQKKPVEKLISDDHHKKRKKWKPMVMWDFLITTAPVFICIKSLLITFILLALFTLLVFLFFCSSKANVNEFLWEYGWLTLELKQLVNWSACWSQLKIFCNNSYHRLIILRILQRTNGKSSLVQTSLYY